MGEGSRFAAGSQKIRVLVVDDEEHLVATIDRMLRRDAEVTVALSGTEGLAQVETSEFDAVLCDMSLADMSGRDVWESIRRVNPELAEHMVFMSGGAITASDHEYLDGLGDRLVNKPFLRDELLAAIRRFARR